jgi:hypothetical protein
VYGQGNFSRLAPADILFLPASAKTVSQQEIEALEAKRIRRLRELGDWRPSSGWQIEPTM